MTDGDADQINNEVRNYLNGPAGQGFDINDEKNNYQPFHNFIVHIVEQFPRFSAIECAAVATASVLNRGSRNGLPDPLRKQLFNILNRYNQGNNFQNTIRMVRDVTIAFSCGNWRYVVKSGPGWDGVWPQASMALASEAIPSVNLSNRWLDEHVVGYQNLRGHFFSDQKKDAECLAMMLLYPDRRRTLSANDEMRIESSGKGTRIRILQKETREVPWGGRVTWLGRTYFEFSEDPGVVHPTDPGANVTIKAENDEVILVVSAQEWTIRPGSPVKITLGGGQSVGFLSQRGTREQIDHVESLLVIATHTGMSLEMSWTQFESDVPAGSKSVFTIADGNLSLFETSGGVHVLTVGEKFVVNGFDEYARKNALTAEGTLQTLRVIILPEEPLTIKGEGAILFWGCTCGTRPCAERHRLSAWDPGVVDLRSFVASAVKGVATKREGQAAASTEIKTGSFSEGMYFALLSREAFARLRLVQVESNVCHRCQGEFEGPRCRIPVQGADGPDPCDTDFDRRLDNRVDRKRIILVDVNPEPYRIKHCCRCTRCKNLFDIDQLNPQKLQKCEGCGNSLVSLPNQLSSGSLLDQVKALDGLLKQINECSSCKCPVRLNYWCPRCCSEGVRGLEEKSCLPQRGMTVWVRTFSSRIMAPPADPGTSQDQGAEGDDES